jgi:hypothetical protein
MGHFASAEWMERSRKAFPSNVPGKGRGLVAGVDIAQGEQIERCCTVPIGLGVWSTLNQVSPLGDFYFDHPDGSDDGLIVLGLISLVNYADQPNADVVWRHEADLGWIAELVATSPIKQGEEITYRYRCGAWFEVSDK